MKKNLWAVKTKKENEAKLSFQQPSNENDILMSSYVEIDLTEHIIKHYLKILTAIEKLGITEIWIGGSRISTKSWFACIFCISKMYVDRQASCVYVMWNKSDHSSRSMRVFDNVLHWMFGKTWPEAIKMWEKKDSPIDKRFIFRFEEETSQEVRFLGMEDLRGGTLEPLPNNYWAVEVVEELSKEGASNHEQSKKFKGAMERINGSYARFFANTDYINKNGEKIRRVEQIIKIRIGNFYDDSDPLLIDFIEKHDSRIKSEPKLLRQLEETGWVDTIDVPNKKMYITTNWKVAEKELGQSVVDSFMNLKRDNPERYKTDGLGLAGVIGDTIYSVSFSAITKINKKANSQLTAPISYTNFRIGIDIGYGGRGQTAIALWGKTINHNGKSCWDTLYAKAINGKDWKNDYLNIREKMICCWKEIQKWEKIFPAMSNCGKIKITLDDDVLWQKGFAEASQEVPQNKGTYEISLFKEKYLKDFQNALRPFYFSPLFESGIFRLITRYSKEPFIAFRSAMFDEEKTIKYKDRIFRKVRDGNDDVRQACEMGIYDEIHNSINENGIIVSSYTNTLLSNWGNRKNG